MKGNAPGRWQLTAAVLLALVLAAGTPSAADETRSNGAGIADLASSAPVSASGGKAGAYQLTDTRLEYPASWRVAQAAPASGESETVEGMEDEPHVVSASELNRQLSNPVTSLWSLQFQFNNYRLENGEWNTTCCSSRCCPSALRRT